MCEIRGRKGICDSGILQLHKIRVTTIHFGFTTTHFGATTHLHYTLLLAFCE